MNLLKYRLAQLVSAANLFPIFKQQQLRRVLMYHSVVKSPGLAHQKSDIYSISETHFIKHVDLLATQNVLGNRKVVALEDSYPSGVSITFDDGYKDTLTIASPLLCLNNLPFHVFVTPGKRDLGRPQIFIGRRTRFSKQTTWSDNRRSWVLAPTFEYSLSNQNKR